MKPSERLKEIEQKGIHYDERNPLMFSGEHKDWLIARVKRLTEALEYYNTEYYYKLGNHPDIKIARKALEGEE